MKPIKPKSCKCCKKPFVPARPLQNVCSPLCAIELGRVKLKEKEEREWQLRKKIGLLKIKTLGEYEAEARKEFQHYIRLRDKDLPCISCQKVSDERWQGSHYFKAELFSGLVFNEKNCHKSCLKCNLFLDGNELGYRAGLIDRYGERYVKDLESIKDQERDRKHTKDELLTIKKLYRGKVKELQRVAI